VKEFLHPDRIVLGGDDERALDALVNVYRPILEQRFPGAGCRKPILVRTTPAVAEAAKYAANAFLAAKVSFINEMANICDRVGADIAEVARIIGLDHRVGPEFLQAGLGWGGSCFAKDLDALIVAAREVGYDPQLLQAARDVNQRQLEAVMAKLQRHLGLLGARVALLGLAFKPGTDDLRGAPALRLAQSLQLRGALVTAFDPLVRAITGMPDVRVTKDPYEAADGADAVVLVTDWPELRKLDVVELRSRMRGDVLVDGRNALDPRAAARAGLVYEGMGRGEVPENSRETTLVRSFRSLGDGGFAASADANLDATGFQSRAVDGNGQSATEASSWETSNDEPDTVAGLWVS
jgi:nucleotide sugar dehydrogenase